MSMPTQGKNNETEGLGAATRGGWRNSKTKEFLRQDILSGRIPLHSRGADGEISIRNKDIQQLRPEYQAMPSKLFAQRLTSLRNSIKKSAPQQSSTEAVDEGRRNSNGEGNGSRSSRQERQEKRKSNKKVSWRKSKTKEMLRKDIMNGTIPLHSRGSDGKTAMGLSEIHQMRPEYAAINYNTFCSRLRSLRETIKKDKSRAADDLVRFRNYCANHEASKSSHKGYIQFQGSTAQKLLEKDIAEGLHAMKKSELWAMRPEYYENFDLQTFRDKLNQMIRTEKYKHTLRVRGKLHKSS